MMAKRMGLLVLLCASLAALPVAAQPGGGGGGGFRGGGISPEQVLGLLAFNDKFEVTDEQLVKLRSNLKETYINQQKMMEELRSGDVDWQAMRETMRENMMAMRIEVMGKVSAVLSEEQIETLKEHMQEMQARRGQFGGGRRGGPRGGGVGGGGGF